MITSSENESALLSWRYCQTLTKPLANTYWPLSPLPLIGTCARLCITQSYPPHGAHDNLVMLAVCVMCDILRTPCMYACMYACRSQITFIQSLGLTTSH